jgi:RHS repeat-associated protein
VAARPWKFESSPGHQHSDFCRYHANRLGSVIAVTDAAGVRTDRYVYTPYGVETDAGGSSGNPFRYTGRRWDEETELYYYRARYYWPEIGRFLEIDPIGYADQMNLYAYVGNSPLMATDPSGRCLNLCTAAIGFGLGFVWGAGGQLIANRGNLSRVDWWQSARAGGFGAAAGSGELLIGGAARGLGTLMGSNVLRHSFNAVGNAAVNG